MSESAFYLDPRLVDKWSGLYASLESLLGNEDFKKYQSMLEDRITDIISTLEYACFDDDKKDYLNVVAKRAAILAYREILSLPQAVFDQLKEPDEHKEGGFNA